MCLCIFSFLSLSFFLAFSPTSLLFVLHLCSFYASLNSKDGRFRPMPLGRLRLSRPMSPLSGLMTGPAKALMSSSLPALSTQFSRSRRCRNSQFASRRTVIKLYNTSNTAAICWSGWAVDRGRTISSVGEGREGRGLSNEVLLRSPNYTGRFPRIFRRSHFPCLRGPTGS